MREHFILPVSKGTWQVHVRELARQDDPFNGQVKEVARGLERRAAAELGGLLLLCPLYTAVFLHEEFTPGRWVAEAVQTEVPA